MLFVRQEKEYLFKEDFELISLSSSCHPNNHKGFKVEISDNGKVFFFGSISKGTDMKLYSSNLNREQLLKLKSILQLVTRNPIRSFYQRPKIQGDHICFLNLYVKSDSYTNEVITSYYGLDYNVKELINYLFEIVQKNKFKHLDKKYNFKTEINNTNRWELHNILNARQ